MESGDINKIIKVTASSGKGCAEVRKGKLNLAGKIGLWCAIFPAADLAGDKEQIAGADGGGVAVRLIKRMTIGMFSCLAGKLLYRAGKYRPFISYRAHHHDGG